MVLRFPEVEKLNNPILQLDEVQFEYTPGNTIFTGVNLSAAMDSRICIVSVGGTHIYLMLHLFTPTALFHYCHFLHIILSNTDVKKE